jgi:hypothetical protein
MESRTFLGPLTYLWQNDKKLTSEKIAQLPILINQYKIKILEKHPLETDWIKLEDPIFVTEIAPEFQSEIIEAYQSLCKLGPNIMLVTYFGGVEENLNWMNKIPFQGLHIDLESAPEQIIFVIKNKIMKTLKILSLGGIKKTDSYYAAIQAYLSDFINHKPEIILGLSEQYMSDYDPGDVSELFFDTKLEYSDKYPKILTLKKALLNLKSQNLKQGISTESLNKITCFMKKRDQVEFINNIKILSKIGL